MIWLVMATIIAPVLALICAELWREHKRKQRQEEADRKRGMTGGIARDAAPYWKNSREGR